MKRIAVMCAVMLLAVVLGCVIRTEHKIDAHITLDIRHVEEEVAGVFDYVEGEAETVPEIASDANGKPTSWMPGAVDLLFPIRTAYAAEPEPTPLVKEIADSMKARYPKLAKAKADGHIGENNQGYAEIRDVDKLDAEAKAKLEQLVKEENEDRKALYKELAKSKKLEIGTVEKVGARDQLKRAKKGEWVQLPPPGEDFEKLKASSMGKALGDKCVPGEWVKVP